MLSYVPPLDPSALCDVLQLCSVRRRDTTFFVVKKDLSGSTDELPLASLAHAHEHEWKPLERTYASGHVFLSPDRMDVYLITTEKQGIRQHQFTGGSPLEDELKSVFSVRDDLVVADLSLAEQNACVRTTNRTSVTSIAPISHVPLVDWVLLERQESWRLVCLMHFVVKSYEGTLSPQVGREDTVGGGWFHIESLTSERSVAPNVSIITEKALEMIS